MVEIMAAADWIDALADVPEAAIEQAVVERIRSPDRTRPIPGEIRQRALERIAKPEPACDDDRPFAGGVVPETELERRREIAARVAKEFPMLRRMTTCEGD